MAVKLSTGLKHQMLNAVRGSVTGTASLAAGVIYIYDGVQPTSPDDAPSGTLLAIITVGSGAFTWGVSTNGLDWDAPAAGVLSKAAAETWSGVGLAAGTARWFRAMGNATDNLGSSTTLPRLDGRCANAGAELNLVNTQVEVGVPVVISSATLQFASGQ